MRGRSRAWPRSAPDAQHGSNAPQDLGGLQDGEYSHKGCQNEVDCGVRSVHDRVCSTGLGPEFGPIERRKDSEFSSVVLCMSLNVHVLQGLPFGC